MVMQISPDTKYTKFIKGPSTYSAYLVSSEIYTTIEYLLDRASL